MLEDNTLTNMRYRWRRTFDFGVFTEAVSACGCVEPDLYAESPLSPGGGVAMGTGRGDSIMGNDRAEHSDLIHLMHHSDASIFRRSAPRKGMETGQHVRQRNYRQLAFQRRKKRCAAPRERTPQLLLVKPHIPIRRIPLGGASPVRHWSTHAEGAAVTFEGPGE
jgi:hypothetical protein